MTFAEYIDFNTQYGPSKQVAFHVEYIKKAIFKPAGGFQYNHDVVYGAINAYKVLQWLRKNPDVYMYQIFVKPCRRLIIGRK